MVSTFYLPLPSESERLTQGQFFIFSLKQQIAWLLELILNIFILLFELSNIKDSYSIITKFFPLCQSWS